MMKVAIVGSGFIGRAWAISFARAGHDVRMWDQSPAATEGAHDYIAGVLGDLAANDLLRGQAIDVVLGRIAVVAELEEALADAVHIQENTPENLDVKREVFSQIDAMAGPQAVIASSTSALLPSKFTDHLQGRHRCLVVHPINPPYLIPAAEVVPAPWTSSETVERTRAFIVDAGHAPLVMKHELDGFIMNRLQGALLEEAFRLVADGYASVEDVDIGIRDGLALRWSFMGRSKRSTLMRRAVYATMSSAINRSMPTFFRRCCAASTGPAKSSRRWRPTAASGCRGKNSANGRFGATAG